MSDRKKGDSVISIPEYEGHTINEDHDYVYIKIISCGCTMTLKCKKKRELLKDTHPLKMLDN